MKSFYEKLSARQLSRIGRQNAIAKNLKSIGG